MDFVLLIAGLLVGLMLERLVQVTRRIPGQSLLSKNTGVKCSKCGEVTQFKGPVGFTETQDSYD